MIHPIVNTAPAAITAVINTRTGQEQGYNERAAHYGIRIGAVGTWLNGETDFDVYGANMRITSITHLNGTPVLTVDACN
jgi:hypothetical protein